MADQSVTLYPGDTLTVNVSAGQAPEPDQPPADSPPAEVPPAPDAAAGAPPDASPAAAEVGATGDVVPASPVASDATGPNVQG